jgi:hypothetical protein
MSEVEDDIKNMLSMGERVLFVARQSRFKPGGSKFTPNTIYLTNQRILFRNPRLLGLKKDYIDVYYRDINQIQLKKGIFSTEIHVQSRFQSDPIKLPAVDKKEAEYIGSMVRKGMAQELEGQVIAEKSSSPKIVTQEKEDPIEQLQKLGKLRDAGIISEEEFDLKKKELMKRI